MPPPPLAYAMIKKKKEKHTERIEKLQLQIDLTQKTRDYNLGTSLRNYIDPRIFQSWTDEVVAEWEKLYTSALQKKFLWVKNVDSVILPSFYINQKKVNDFLKGKTIDLFFGK